MTTSFPTGLDSLSNPSASDAQSAPSHAGQHANANDAIEALEAKVGVNSSAVATSLDYLAKTAVDPGHTHTTGGAGIPATLLDAKGDLVVASANDTAARLAVGSNNQVLTADSAQSTGVKWATVAVPTHAGSGTASTVLSGDDTATASAARAIAVGSTSAASQIEALAVGSFAASSSTQTVTIGSGVNATAAPVASAQGGIAVGASNDTAQAGARASGVSSIAIGSGTATRTGAAASAARAIAVGVNSIAAFTDSMALGAFASCGGANSIAVGSGATATPSAGAAGVGAIAMGSNWSGSVVGSRGTGDYSVAIGSGDSSYAGASATGADAISLGRRTTAAHDRAVAIGYNTNTTAADQVNIGIKRLFAGAPATAPADADLVASQASVWVNEAGNALTFKVKYAAGTVKSGTVALA